jgi:hypothetical protein
MAAGLAVEQVFGDRTIAAAGRRFPGHGNALHLAGVARAADDKFQAFDKDSANGVSRRNTRGLSRLSPQTPTLRAAVL